MSDMVVGMWFHTFHEREPTEEEHAQGDTYKGRLVKWQGQVVGPAGDGYLVECYSWFDGTANGRKLVSVKAMHDWEFYETHLAMQAALGCREGFAKRRGEGRSGYCGNEATHIVESAFLGAVVRCHRCIKFYAGKARELTDKDLRASKPTLRETRSTVVAELANDLKAATKGAS